MMFGKRHSVKTKEKMRQAKLKNPTRYWLGKKTPQSTIEAVRKSKLGKPAWNKGKKGLQTAWNKGTKGITKAWNKGIPNLNFKGVKNPN